MKPMSGNSPQQSAGINLKAQAESQASLARAVGGRGKRRVKRGGSGIPAPYMQTPYPVAGAGDQNPNSIMLNNAKMESQGGANAVYDSSARNMKGGTMWGCYSGGKRRRRTCTKRRSHKKKRKARKMTRKRN
jgi:hypothetical protein